MWYYSNCTVFWGWHTRTSTNPVKSITACFNCIICEGRWMLVPCDKVVRCRITILGLNTGERVYNLDMFKRRMYVTYKINRNNIHCIPCFFSINGLRICAIPNAKYISCSSHSQTTAYQQNRRSPAEQEVSMLSYIATGGGTIINTKGPDLQSFKQVLLK